jgi:hypothetical protein
VVIGVNSGERQETLDHWLVAARWVPVNV